MIFAKTGGVLTFVLTLTSIATVTERNPKSILLPSRRKTAPRHLWVKQPADSHKTQKRRFGSLAASERKALRTQGTIAVINSDLSSLNISRNAKRALHHVSREAAYAKQTTYAQCKAPPCLCPRQSFNNCSTIAQRPCAYVFAKPRLTLRLPWEAALFFCYSIKEGLF